MTKTEQRKQRVSSLQIQESFKLGFLCDLFLVGVGGEEVDEWLIVLVEGSKRIGGGRIDAGGFEVDASDGEARDFHETLDLVPAP